MMTPSDYDAASIPELMELLRSDNPPERGDAACALGDRLRSLEVRELDPPVLDALARLLEDDAPIVQFEAAVALAEAHDHRATELLLLASKHREFRLDAVRALGTLGNPAAIAPLLHLMGRWLMPWADKLQAAAALCALGDDQGATYLGDKLSSRRRAERAAAIHFVGESHHPRALEILSGILADPRDPMRDVAARSLGFIAAPAAKAALQAARTGASADLCEDIDLALQRIDRESERA